MRAEDLDECAALCRRVHGIERSGELRDALNSPLSSPFVLRRGGKLVAYASAPTFWPFNHGVAQTERDLTDLLLAAALANTEPLAFLLPTRQASLFRWCLEQGLRIVKPMTLMTIGEYHEPKGSYYASVLY